MVDYLANIITHIAVFILGMVAGGAYTMDVLQENAIKANAAHYVCNQETGDCKFEFK